MTGYEKPALFLACMTGVVSSSVLDNGNLIPLNHTVVIPFKRPKNKKVTPVWNKLSISFDYFLTRLCEMMIIARRDTPRAGLSGLPQEFSWPDGL